MQNTDIVVSSREKIVSHWRINRRLFKWLRFVFSQVVPARIITMPANSGRQENVICRHLAKLQKNFDLEGLVKLYTYDDTWRKEDIAIDSKGIEWEHSLCKDIFTELLVQGLSERETAAWFDLAGGLTDANKSGLQQCVQILFAPGSILFITLQVHGARGVFKNNTRDVYNNWTQGPQGRVVITDSLLKEAMSETDKSIQTIMNPYVYRRGTTTYAVYGYIIKIK